MYERTPIGGRQAKTSFNQSSPSTRKMRKHVFKSKKLGGGQEMEEDLKCFRRSEQLYLLLKFVAVAYGSILHFSPIVVDSVD